MDSSMSNVRIFLQRLSAVTAKALTFRVHLAVFGSCPG